MMIKLFIFFPSRIIIYIIIIMERRNILHPVKLKPKLVIKRHPTTECKEGPKYADKTISVLKALSINKQNEKMPQIFLKTSSLQKTHRRLERSMSTFLPSPVDNSENKLIKKSEIYDFPHFDLEWKAKTEEVINKLLKTIKPIRQSIQMDDPTLREEARIKRILSIVFEAAPNSKHLLRIVDQKINFLLQPRLLHSNQQKSLHSALYQRPSGMDFHKYINQSFSFNVSTPPKDVSCSKRNSQAKRITKQSLSSGVVSHQLYNQLLQERNSFVFQHLDQVNDYILSQPNKILHQAFRRHKYLQEEMFAYADLISISKIGSNVYTPEINILKIESELDRSMRVLNRQLMQGNESQESKNKRMRDYVLQVRQEYSNILKQFISVINKGTQQAKTFMSKIISWQENYLTRKEYLSNLKTEYCDSLFRISQALADLKSSYDVDTWTKHRIITIEESLSKINNIYLLGNSFY